MARTPIADTDFARRLQGEYNVTVLPGTYLGREGVASTWCRLCPHCAGCHVSECLEAAAAFIDFCQNL